MSNAWISGVVLAGVAERRVDAALGRAGVAARRVELRDDRDVRARVVRLDRRAHACAARPDHEYVVLRVHLRGRYRIGPRLRAANRAEPWPSA